MTTSLRRIPSLDGLRALAALLVLVGHAAETVGFPESIRGLLFIDVARMGVNVFFVLSGFLITGLLIDERGRTGTVSLRSFYVRRSIRIFPAAYALIGAVAVLAAVGSMELRPGDLLHAATYTMNYHHDRGWGLGHLWSVAVEEQFYLLWPVSFLIVAPRRIAWWLAAVIVIVPVWRVASWLLLPESRVGIDEEFQTVCDALATGCLLALLVGRHGVAGLALKIPKLAFACAPLVVLASYAAANRPSIALSLGITLGNMAIALIILWAVANESTPVGRLLNCRLAVFLGTISYSLYLWQQIFMDTALKPGAIGFPANVFLALAAAVASYYLIEAPLLQLRRRFKR